MKRQDLGTFRGLALAHRRYGSLPWATLVAPAVAIARDGFVVDANLAGSMNATLEAAPEFPEFQRVFGKPGGGAWAAGDRLTQPDLARTLQLLADRGPDAFYTGPIADAILAEMARGNGLMTAADLAGYRAREGPALTTRYRDYDVCVPPPPCSGGTVLLEELNVLEAFNLKAWGRWGPMTVHVMTEAMRRANYDRARYLGDPAFVQVPSKLIAPNTAASSPEPSTCPRRRAAWTWRRISRCRTMEKVPRTSPSSTAAAWRWPTPTRSNAAGARALSSRTWASC